MSSPQPLKPRPDIPYCVIAFEENDRLHTMRLPESLIHYAVTKGWHVLARDSEMPQGPHDPVEPAQSNPQRDPGDEAPRDWGEQ